MIKWVGKEKKGTREGIWGVSAKIKGSLRKVWKPNILEAS